MLFGKLIYLNHKTYTTAATSIATQSVEQGKSIASIYN